MSKYILKNAEMWDYRGKLEGDLAIDNGIIIESNKADSTFDTIECSGKLIMPAMIDINTHLKTFLSIKATCQKALKGGVSTLLIKSDKQQTDRIESQSLAKIITGLSDEVNLFPSINGINDEGKMADISMLVDNGAVAINVKSDENSNMVYQNALYAKMLNVPLICFCQDGDMARGVINVGEMATKLGLPSILPISQTKEVAKIAEMLKNLDIKIIFSNLAYPRSLDILDMFKSANTNQNMFGMVSVHHLLLDDSMYKNYNTTAKINPPLLHKTEQEKMIKALKQGQIDIINSAQIQNTNFSKDQVFELANNGIDALEYYFALLYTMLHKKYDISLNQISLLSAKMPSNILGLNCGSLEIGAKAEIAIIDTNKSIQINDPYSPYHNETLYGVVENIIK